jgi:CubicO group peptidase (beta-lactamase class C family)
MILVACAALLLVIAFPAMAQGIDATTAMQVDRTVNRVLARDAAPSASVAIVMDGRMVYAKAFGLARLSPRASATTATGYQLASISKTFTAEAALLLEQEGKLSLGDPVSRWIGGLTSGDRVTLRQLLNHTSGYPDHYPQLYPAGPRARPISPDQIIAEWGRHPLLFEPGTRFSYSNFNYVLAGRIIEKAAGEPLFSFLQRRVFRPLGMTAALDLDALPAMRADVAAGYIRPALDDLKVAPDEGRGWSFGAGNVIDTASDLATWDAAFLAGNLLGPMQMAEQVTPPKLPSSEHSSYALGLELETISGRKVYSHVGQGLGYLAINRIYPAERSAIVVLTNDSSSIAFREIADRIAFLVLPPTPEEAEAREVFASVQAGHPVRRRFAPDFRRYFDTAMQRAYARSLAPLGSPETFELKSETVADGLTTRIFTAVVGEKRLRITEQRLPDGSIEGFEVVPSP